MSGSLLLILGNQLFGTRYLRAHRAATLLMVEDPELCRRLPFHQQKLVFILAAMRQHRDELRRRGYDLHYFDLDSGCSLEQAVTRVARAERAERLLLFETEDRHAAARLEACADAAGLTVDYLDSPMFLTPAERIDAFFDTAAIPRMADFYRQQRQRLDLLMDDGEPRGGKWSLDAENRNAVGADVELPTVPGLRHPRVVRGAIADVARHFPTHPGTADGLWLPTSRRAASRWLNRFLGERLVGFGSYEDAITERSATLHHSVLSPLLNVGLITPGVVIERTLRHAASHPVPLNDLEGFVRQMVGWREFIRGAYRAHGQRMRSGNAWNAERRLTASWFDGSTGIVPLDQALRGAVDHAWNHHIERLMVIANLMNLCEIRPADVYRFFMSYYVDAYDWVMVPNVFGMGLTSDGGVFATKPYICGSNYLRKMSDLPAGPWCDVVDGLYWRFIERHRETLARNPRLAMATRGLDRIDAGRREKIRSAAEAFLANHTGVDGRAR